MRLRYTLLFCALAIGVIAEGEKKEENVNSPPAPPPTPDQTTKITVGPTPGPTTSTAKPSSTNPPPTPPPTTKPTPPTTKPTTTTAKPTTTSPSTPPTTPSTTTTAKPSPTPRPAPVPEPKPGNWSIIDLATNRTCLIINMAVQLEITKFNNTNSTLQINLPANQTATGSCLANETIEFNVPVNNLNVTNVKFVFSFGKNNETKKYALDNVMVNVVGGNSSFNFTHETAEYVTPLENSYKCSKVEDLTLSGPTKAVLHLSDVQWQAFANSTDKKFSSAMDCEGSQTPDVVPIAVGCVLVALIVLVLVGYLFGRRRCQARGYLSM